MSNLDVQVDKDGSIRLWMGPLYIDLDIDEAFDLGVRLITAASRAATIRYYRNPREVLERWCLSGKTKRKRGR